MLVTNPNLLIFKLTKQALSLETRILLILTLIKIKFTYFRVYVGFHYTSVSKCKVTFFCYGLNLTSEFLNQQIPSNENILRKDSLTKLWYVYLQFISTVFIDWKNKLSLEKKFNNGAFCVYFKAVTIRTSQ